MSLLLLALALADLQLEKPAKTYTKAQLGSLTTTELAREFLEPETAKTVSEHRLLEDVHSWGTYHGIRFWSPLRRVGADLCVRDIEYASLRAIPDTGKPPLVQPNERHSISPKASAIALAGDCSKVNELAHVNFISSEAAADLLRYVVQLRDNARAGRDLRVEITCRSMVEPSICQRDLRQIVAKLPVERPRIISRESPLSGGGWSITFSEHPLPSLYWEVNLDDVPSRARRVRLSWEYPAPF